ncbi:MAG: S1 RNA-binding domain-containing protein [Pelagibacteraceae bacterium]
MNDKLENKNELIDSNVTETNEEVKTQSVLSKIKNYLSKDLFSGVKVIDINDDQVSEEKATNLEEYRSTFSDITENQIINARVIGISDSDVMVDIGFKSEGLISRSEFENQDLPEIGSDIEVFLDKFEDNEGNISLSKYKADFIKRWEELIQIAKDEITIKGKILKRVKGGLVVDLGVIQAFLPGSQADVQPIKNFDDLIGKELDFLIVKVDEVRKNLVVSRKAILEESLNERRQELMQNIEIGTKLEGVVKNITDFGAFIDLGGVDGLVHITDFSWGRINHPSEIVSIGDKINVQVVDYDQKTSRISLGIKQLIDNPWQSIPEKYKVNDTVDGKIVSVMNYGIFVELEKGIEGLIHISEVSWVKNIQNLQDSYKVGDKIQAKVLSVEPDDQKISLGIKQLSTDPWLDIDGKFQVGDKGKGIVSKITKFGAFIELDDKFEGFVRIVDLDWKVNPAHPRELINEGETVEFIISDISSKERKILLSIKDLNENPWVEISKNFQVGSTIAAKFESLEDNLVKFKLEGDIQGIVPMNKVSKDVKKNILPELKSGSEIQLTIEEVNEKGKNIALMFDNIKND